MSHGPVKSSKNDPITALIVAAIILVVLVIVNIQSHESIEVSMVIINENEQPIYGAKVEGVKNSKLTNNLGKATLKLSSPDTLLISKEGFLTEIVPIGWESNKKEMKIKILSNADGKRVVINFGGDAIFGRRLDDKEPIDIVKNISRVFSTADLGIINLESTIGNMSEESSLKGKNYLLQSKPKTLVALKSLGVGLVTLANNHTRDWGDAGVENTIKTLTDAGIAYVGAGTEQQARTPNIIEKNGLKIGTLAYSSLDGSFVNGYLPDNSQIKPNSVDASDDWMWEKKQWSYSNEGFNVPQGKYRPGEIWKRYSDVKGNITSSVRFEIEKELEKTFTGMQFWTAGSEHSGAAYFREKEAAEDIKDLRKKADLVIVEIHSGIQYAGYPQNKMVKATHDCIDAGADIVIAHHPHVLQGMEWYKGKLIAYSMGNIVFDQDFFSTFSSGILRTVWEKGGLVQARFIPIEQVNYISTPVTDVSSRRIIKNIWDLSVQNAVTKRNKNEIKSIYQEKSKDSIPVQFKFDQGSALLVKETTKTEQKININKGEILKLDDKFLWPANFGNKEVLVNTLFIGRDIFGWGHFEDTLVDEESKGDTHLNLAGGAKWVSDEASIGKGFIRLFKRNGNPLNILVRTVARIPLNTYDLYNLDKSSMLPDATYSVCMNIRTKGNPKLYLRTDTYNFNDKNPVKGPQSNIIESKEYKIDNKYKTWGKIEIPLEKTETINGEKPNMVMVYLILKSSDKDSIVDIDNVEFIEWRDASVMPQIYGGYTHVRNNGDKLSLKLDVMGG